MTALIAGLFNFTLEDDHGVSGGIPCGMGAAANASPALQAFYVAITANQVAGMAVDIAKTLWSLGKSAFGTISARLAGDRILRESLKEGARVGTTGAVERGMATSGKATGTATVRHFVNPDGSPHFTVEVQSPGGKTLQTHQIWASAKGRTTQFLEVEAGELGKAAGTKTFNLAEADAANQMQWEQIERGVTGKWEPTGVRANSCATGVCEVLVAGGADAPANRALARPFAYRLFNIPMPR